MAEFASTLGFVWVPFLAALVYALVLPPLGAGLHLRNESLLGIALPPAGAALMALAAAFGLETEHGLFLFLGVAVGLGLLVALLPPGAGPRSISLRSRALLLAAIFTIANAVLLLILVLSPQAQAHLLHVMNGELLSVGVGELIAALGIAVALGVAGFRYRGYVLAYVLDEEMLRVRFRRHRTVAVAFHAAAVLAITGAVLMTGPLLCAALLILPPLFAEKRARGLLHYAVFSAILGIVGVMVGFVGALTLDWPPAPTAVAGILMTGLVIRLILVRHGRG